MLAALYRDHVGLVDQVVGRVLSGADRETVVHDVFCGLVQSGRLVDRHFAGGLGPSDERALRDHLPGCAACRDRYHRQLLLEGLDPRRSRGTDLTAPQLRLARALGLRPRPARRFAVPVLALTAALAVALVVGVGATSEPRIEPVEIAARGAGDAASRVHAYRITAGDRVSPLEGTMARADELAFAYENPAGWARLLVFAADEHGRVFWYHPSWQDPVDAPTAIAIEAGPARRELPAAIRHDLEGSRLRLHYVFVTASLSVHDLEAAVAAAPALAAELAIPGPHAQASQLVEVQP